MKTRIDFFWQPTHRRNFPSCILARSAALLSGAEYGLGKDSSGMAGSWFLVFGSWLMIIGDCKLQSSWREVWPFCELAGWRPSPSDCDSLNHNHHPNHNPNPCMSAASPLQTENQIGQAGSWLELTSGPNLRLSADTASPFKCATFKKQAQACVGPTLIGFN